MILVLKSFRYISLFEINLEGVKKIKAKLNLWCRTLVKILNPGGREEDSNKILFISLPILFLVPPY